MDLAKLLATLNHLPPHGGDPVTAREVAELLWRAQQINPSATLPERASPLPEQSAEVGAASVSPPSLPNPATPSNPAPPSNQVGVHLRGKEELESGGSEPKKVAGSGSLAFRSPTGAALPGSLELARALRPLMRRVPSRSRFLLNEKATVQRIAEEDIWSPVLDPAPEHWLDVALVLDEGPSMALWQRTFSELRRLLECQGAFKNVRTWGLDSSSRDKLSFYAGAITGGNLSRRSTSPNELVSLRGRRLIMLVTDCISPAWYGEALLKILQSWGEHNTLVVVQVLPQRLWRRTALGIASAGRLDLPFPGAANQRAALTKSSNIFADKEELDGLPIPVVTLEPPILNAWAKIIGQARAGWTPLFVLNPPWREQRLEPYSPTELEAEKLLRQFRAVASPLAQRLAVFLAATPISLPVVRLVQRTMLPQSRQVHLAELFLSGLLKLTAPHPHPDYAQYDFVDPKVRALLLDSLLFSESLTVLEEVSKLVASRTGLPLDFQALLADPDAVDGLFIP
ncbi:MAG: SAV_2336 N-terminal domain-related protein, partial [Chloroflexota bacterium]